MKIVRNDLVAKFMLEGVLGVEFCAPFAGFVMMDEGFPVGAYILNCYTGMDVSLTVATSKRLSLGCVRAMAREVFGVFNVARVTAKTRVSNIKASKALEAIGFRSEGIARDHFGDEDAVVYALLRREQKIVRI